MRLLVLGGTKFLGRHLVEIALRRGDEVTIFNRGQTNPGLFPEVERLRGDRYGSLEPLRGRSWDAAVDTSGYVSANVRAVVALLADAVRHYTFISSLSVYSDNTTPDQDEGGPLEQWTGGEEDARDMATYGARKALCEQAAEAAMPGRVLNMRAGLIVGPYDPTGRFTYWVRRVAAGNEVLAPGQPTQPVQFIDARDLAGWVLRMAEAGRAGTYNTTGPAEPFSMAELLQACRDASGSDASFTWVTEHFLVGHGVEQWSDLPLWLAAEYAGFQTRKIDKALAAGLTFRPVVDTVRDTLEWSRAATGGEIRAGISREREQELLRAWHGS